MNRSLVDSEYATDLLKPKADCIQALVGSLWCRGGDRPKRGRFERPPKQELSSFVNISSTKTDSNGLLAPPPKNPPCGQRETLGYEPAKTLKAAYG